MMKLKLSKNWWLLIKVFFAFNFYFGNTKAFAQNLVPNNSFEQYDTCPDYYGQISRAISWKSPTTGNPDYFNACDTINGYGVPINVTNANESAKDGYAYSGLYTFWSQNPNGREYIQTELLQPLKPQKNYFVRFYVSLIEPSNYATNSIGAYFSQLAIYSNDFEALSSFQPQVINPSNYPLTNKEGWTQIAGNFTAQGGEKFLTIGVFKDSIEMDTFFLDSNCTFCNVSYYLIDDVLVMEDTSNSINELEDEKYFSIFPNPASTSVTIKANSGDEIKIFDVMGREIKAMKHFKYSTDLSTNEIANGVYFLSLYRNNRHIATEKLFVAK